MSIASLSVDTAVGVVTALTGLIAAAVAATQLSYRHRMMRTATWAQEQIPSATGERKQHLEDMQHWAQSEVVAATMIPAWKYGSCLLCSASKFWSIGASSSYISSAVAAHVTTTGISQCSLHVSDS